MLLTVDGLSVQHVDGGGRKETVSDVSLEVGEGTIVGLIGETGCGKSTVALAILGLARPGGRIVAGSVRLDGRVVLDEGKCTVKAQEHRMALIVQNPRGALNPLTTVGQQMKTVFRGYFGRKQEKQDIRRRVQEVLDLVRLDEPDRIMRSYPHELSGGMAQRVLIATALLTSPKVLIADEPTTALDVTIQAEILDLLAELARTRGLGVLMITHDMGVIANYADRTYVMHSGEIVESAGTPELFPQPCHPVSLSALSSDGAWTGYSRFRLVGMPPDLHALPRGCWLQHRCPFADESAGCFDEHPNLTLIDGGHRGVRCHRWQEVAKATMKQTPGPAREVEVTQ